MQLSIIIPAFNEEAIIGETLEKIDLALSKNEHLGVSWEVIVCDNNSNDHTAVIAREAGAKVVFEPVNQISRARNTGADAATGDWLLFIDADSYPPPGLITETMAVIQEGDSIGCSSTIKVTGGPLWYRKRLESHNWEMRLFRSCVGAYLLCEADAFRKIGGFSSKLYALEEIEFAKRLKRYGRSQHKAFRVLHAYPVRTSGRKGALHSKLAIFRSIGLALWSLVTGRPIRSKESLPYWYDDKR